LQKAGLYYVLPGTIILITEDNIIASHLDDGMKFIAPNKILHSIRAHEIGTAIFAIMPVHLWPSVNHYSSATIWICDKLISRRIKLFMIGF
jgi:hypothetical protein